MSGIRFVLGFIVALIAVGLILVVLAIRLPILKDNAELQMIEAPQTTFLS